MIASNYSRSKKFLNIGREFYRYTKKLLGMVHTWKSKSTDLYMVWTKYKNLFKKQRVSGFVLYDYNFREVK